MKCICTECDCQTISQLSTPLCLSCQVGQHLQAPKPEPDWVAEDREWAEREALSLPAQRVKDRMLKLIAVIAAADAVLRYWDCDGDDDWSLDGLEYFMDELRKARCGETC